MTTLEERRKRGDLIEVYKLLTQNVDYNNKQLILSEGGKSSQAIRGHSSKVFIPIASEQNKSPEIVFQPQGLGQLEMEQVTSGGC